MQLHIANSRSGTGDLAVKVYWLHGDENNESLFATIAKGGDTTMNTFVGHKWVVRDASTGALLKSFSATKGQGLISIE